MSDFEKKAVGKYAEIREFIEKTIAAPDFAGEKDFWEAFSDEIDVHFSVNDNEESPFFNQMEFFAYPIIKRNKCDETDTSEFVIISLIQKPWQSTTLEQTFAPTGIIQTASLCGSRNDDFEGELAHRNGDGETALIKLTRRPPTFAHDFVLLNV